MASPVPALIRGSTVDQKLIGPDGNNRLSVPGIRLVKEYPSDARQQAHSLLPPSGDKHRRNATAQKKDLPQDVSNYTFIGKHTHE